MRPYPPTLEDLPFWAKWNCWTYVKFAQHEWGGYVSYRRSQIAAMYGLPWGHPLQLVPHFLYYPCGGIVTHLGPTDEQRECDSARHWIVFWLRLWKIPSARIIHGDACEPKIPVPELEPD